MMRALGMWLAVIAGIWVFMVLCGVFIQSVAWAGNHLINLLGLG